MKTYGVVLLLIISLLSSGCLDVNLSSTTQNFFHPAQPPKPAPNVDNGKNIHVYPENFIEIPDINPHFSAKKIRLYNTTNADYHKYINGRYAYSIWIPSSCLSAKSPDNSDGCTFYFPNSVAKISVSGSHNASHFTIEKLYQELSQKHNIQYTTRGDNWLVVSYTENQTIVYLKTFISNEYINEMGILYPISQKEKFDEIVSTVEETFIPGWKTGYPIKG
jgi:hypothetical protein